MSANLSRNFVLYVFNTGHVVYFDQDNQPEITENGPWPIVSVDTHSEAQTLLVLFCVKEYPNYEDSPYIIPGYQGTKDDLPFVVNRFVDGYFQMRNNKYVQYSGNVRNR